MAGDLRRAQPDLSEEIALIRVMRDSNIPKFLPDDIPLFNALIKDLFPGRELPPKDFGKLDDAIRKVIKR